MRTVGLERRITLSVAVGLTAILFFFGFLALTAVQQSKDLVLEERLALGKTIAGHIDYILRRTLRQVEEIVSLSPMSRGDHTPDDERQLLYDVYHKLGAFAMVQLVDRDGRVTHSEPPLAEELGQNVSDAAHIQRLFRSGSSAIDLITPADPGHAPMIVLGVPVVRQGTIVGAVVAKSNLARLGLDTLPAPNLGATGRSELIARTGFVIASSDAVDSSIVDHVVVLDDLLESRQPGIRTHRMPAGSSRPDHIVAFAPLSTLPWGIVVEQDQDVALALPQELQQKMLIAGFLSVLVTGFVAWVDVRRLVAPLRTLTLASQRMAAGSLDSPVDVRRGDEVGTLARSFETMRVQLKLSLEEIRRWNEELEQRVAQRTRELEQRNQELLAINYLAETVNRTLDLDQVLETALDQVLAITESEVGSISLRDTSGTGTSRRIVRSPDDGAWREPCQILGGCLCQRVAQSGEPLMTGRAVAPGPTGSPVCWGGNYQSLGILPLRSKDGVQGSLCVISSRPNHFSSSQQNLLVAISHQIGTAVENARLYSEIQQREVMRRQLLAKVISAQEEERRRLARELHDESTQALTGLIMSIQTTQDALPPELEREKERLARAKAQTIHALTEMRQMILDLRPTALDDLGLVPAIRWYAETHLQPLGIQASVEVSGIKRRLSPEIETSLFRICQEAINNVAKHSQARTAGIRLEIQQAQIQCRVEDNGIGFDADSYSINRDPYKGLGLVGIRERVSLLGGSLAIESAPKKGTCLWVFIPLEDA